MDRKAGELLKDLYRNLDPWRKCQVARHPDVAAALAAALPAAPHGTRVLPPEWLWLAAQGGDLAELMDGWLAGRPMPAAPVRQRW